MVNTQEKMNQLTDYQCITIDQILSNNRIFCHYCLIGDQETVLT